MEATVDAIAKQAIAYFDARQSAVDHSSVMRTGLLGEAIKTALAQVITSDAKAFELWRDTGNPLPNDEFATGSDWMSYIINHDSIYGRIVEEVVIERPDIEVQTRYWRNTLATLYRI